MQWRSIGLLLLAIIFRLSAVGRYVTPDETFWQFLGMRVREGVLSGDWSAVIQTGQPGIITTWIAALGIQITVWLQPHTTINLEWARSLVWLSTESGEPYRQLNDFLFTSRLITILLTSIAILIIVSLIQRTRHQQSAWIVGLLLAIDPFLAGLSGLLISDALLGICVVIALIASLSHNNLPSPFTWLLIGSVTACAFLNKLPGIILLGFVPLFIAVKAMIGSSQIVLKPLFYWSIGIIVTVVLLLPIAWLDPEQLVAVLQRSAAIEIDKVIPTFFMGEMTPNPSVFYYPLAIIFRLSPIVMPCIVILIARKTISTTTLCLLLLFAVVFIVGLEQSTRSYDRYALPIMMLLTIGAGVGIAGMSRKWSRLLLLIAFIHSSVHIGYPLLAYNTLFGGRLTAQHILPIGWGEIESAAARQLTKTSQPPYPPIFTENVPAVAPFYAGRVIPLRPTTMDDITANARLIIPTNHPLAAYMQTRQAITINGQKRFVGTILTKTKNGTITDTNSIWKFVDAPMMIHAERHTVDNQMRVRLLWRGFISNSQDNFIVHIGLTNLNALDNADEYTSLDAPLVDITGQPSYAWQSDKQYVVDLLISLPDTLPQIYDVRLSLFTEDGRRIGVYENDTFAGVHVAIDPIE